MFTLVVGPMGSFQFHCMDSRQLLVQQHVNPPSLSIPLYGFKDGSKYYAKNGRTELSIPLYGFII